MGNDSTSGGDMDNSHDLATLGGVMSYAKEEFATLLVEHEETGRKLNHLRYILNKVDPDFTPLPADEEAVARDVLGVTTYTTTEDDDFLDPERSPSPELNYETAFAYSDASMAISDEFSKRADACIPSFKSVKHLPRRRTRDLIPGVYARIHAINNNLRFERFNDKDELPEEATLVYVIRLLESIQDESIKNHGINRYHMKELNKIAELVDDHRWKRVTVRLQDLLKNMMGCWASGQSTTLAESAMSAYKLKEKQAKQSGA
jgi:hypothetical protein